MPYVHRDSAGKLIAVSIEPLAGYESVSPDLPELLEFEASLMPLRSRLRETDKDLVRVLDDLVNVLIDKNLIRFTDLPEAAQHKLIERRGLRESKSSLGLLGNDRAVL
jgi:hypothetical protein